MRIIYFFFLATLLWSFWVAMTRLRRRGTTLAPTLGWMLGLGFFILSPLTVMVFNGGYKIPSFYESNDSYAEVNLSNAQYFVPFLVIWESLLFSFLAVIFFTPGPDDKSERHEIVFNEPKLRIVALITAGLALLEYVTTIWMVGGLEAFLVSDWYQQRWQLIEQMGSPYAAFLWLSRINKIIFTVTAVLYMHFQVSTKMVRFRFSILIVSLFILYTVLDGERMFFALYVLSFVASCWLYRRRRLIAALLMIAPVFAIVFSAWAYFRNNPTAIGEDIPSYVEGDLGNRAITSLINACEGSDTMVLFHIINDFGYKYDFLYGSSYSRIISFWIPRDLYPQKPTAFEVRMAAVYEPGQVTSINGTALGEMYANFGFISILTLPILTLSSLYFDGWLTKKGANRAVFSATAFLVFIWVARATFLDDMVILFFAGILIWALRLEKSLCSATNCESRPPICVVVGEERLA